MKSFPGITSDQTDNLLLKLTQSVFMADSYGKALQETLLVLSKEVSPIYSECRSKSAKSSVWIITAQIYESGKLPGGEQQNGSDRKNPEFLKPSLEVIDETWITRHTGINDPAIPKNIRRKSALSVLNLHFAFGNGRNDLFRFFFELPSGELEPLKRRFNDLLPSLKKILQKKYDHKLTQDSEQRYKRLFDEDLNPSFITSPDGSIKNCNKAFVDLFGFKSKKAALQSNFDDRFTNYMHQVYFWETLQRCEQVNNYEMPASTVTGNNIHTILKATGSYDRDSNLLEVVGYIQDITNRKEVEVALRKSEERYRSLIETTNDWIWEVDENFRFTYSSLKIQTILGYELNAVLGNSIFDLIPGNKRESVEDRFTELARQQKAFVGIELSFEDSEDDIVIFETSGIPLFTNNGIFQGYRGIAKNITERKKTERQISRMNDELEHKVIERTKMLRIANKELEAFSYSVSHDLRAPLRSIDGFSQALIEDYADTLDETAMNYLARVRSAAQRMSTLIDDMIKLAKVSRTELARKQINLTKIAKSISDSLKEQSPDRSARFTIEPNLLVNGDENLMKVVLQNLMENAWKFTAREPETHIEVGSEELNGETTYYVRDNGAGFDMNYAKKLFTPFQRLHKQTDFPGTGIGLSTVQRIIHRHLGRIWAEGAVGEGAVFYFTMEPNSENNITKSRSANSVD